MKMPLDLARKMPGQTDIKGLSIETSPTDNSPVYPTLFLEWDKKYDMPESGTMTVKFVRKSENTRKQKDGKVHQTVELDITSIEDVEAGERAEDDETPTGEVLDKMAEEYEEGEDE